MPGEETPAVKAADEGRGLLPQRRIRLRRPGEKHLMVRRFRRRIPDADGRQLLRRESEVGDAAHRQQGQILIGVVHHPQNVHDVLDLPQVVILGVGIRVYGDARLLQGFGVDLRASGGVAQEDDDIPVMIPGAGGHGRIPLTHQVFDPLHDAAGLPGGALGDALLPAGFRVGGNQQPEFGLRALRRVDTAPAAGPEAGWRRIAAKKRCIDPMVLGQGRLSELSLSFADRLAAFRAQPQDYWVLGGP